MNLGVLSLGLSLFGPSEALFGIAQEADRNGYETSLVPVDRADRATMAAAIRRLVAGAVDGIVLLTSVQTAVDALSSLDHDVPVVLFGPGTPEDPSIVTIDEEAGARAATEHLLALGHRTVHHVSGVTGWLADAARIRGWSGALSEAGRVVPPPIRSDWTTASGYDAGLRIADDPSVTAVFASNDHVALGVIKALTDQGVRVPEDVSVVGFDDVPQSAFLTPALTTVRVDFAEAGRACVRRILAALDDDVDAGVGPARPQLVLRDSTTAPSRLS